jgi:hypothetical protein
MAFWFLRGLRKGIVTTRYPAEVDPWAALLPTPPMFDPRKLNRPLVDRLIEACPSTALVRDDDFLVVDLGACSGCGRCLALAGAAARASGVFELAATSRQQLVKRVPIEGPRP